MSNSSEEIPRHLVMLASKFTPNSQADHLIGGLLILCFLVGVTGNIIALVFFWTVEKNKVVSNLYLLISFTDLCTCVMQVPVAVILLMDRDPGLFRSLGFCTFWTVIFEFLQASSIFLVMLMSVTRAIAISLPLCNIDIGCIFRIYLCYVFLIFSESALRQAFGVYYMFMANVGYCVKGSRNPSYKMYANVTYIIIVALPSIITFFSFIISIVSLKRQSLRPSRVIANRASVTIAIFTATFLICNFPFISNIIVFVVALEITKYPGPFFSSTFMFSYSWIFTKVLCVVLNAVLNPIIYFTRMAEFRSWKPFSKQRFLTRINTIRTWNGRKSNSGGSLDASGRKN